MCRDGGRVTIGAMTSVAELEELPDPLGTAARHVADGEIRRQGTIGGNLCAPPGVESPRGDLQAALIALGAQVRSTGAGGERTEPIEDFLAGGAEGRLVLDVPFDEPEAGGARASPPARPRLHRHEVSRRAGRTARSVSPSRASARARCAYRRRGGARRRRRRRAAPPLGESSRPTTRSRPPGTGRGRCRSSCGGRWPSSTEERRPHETHGQRRRARRAPRRR